VLGEGGGDCWGVGEGKFQQILRRQYFIQNYESIVIFFVRTSDNWFIICGDIEISVMYVLFVLFDNGRGNLG